jgi:hypothetical protein
LSFLSFLLLFHTQLLASECFRFCFLLSLSNPLLFLMAPAHLLS